MNKKPLICTALAACVLYSSAVIAFNNIEPTAHAVARTNVLRDDVPSDPFPREAMLANAPDLIEGELVKVPQVLPGEGIA